jgi:hypothetical protein
VSSSASPPPRSASKQGSRQASRASSAEKRSSGMRTTSGQIGVAYEPSSSSVHHVRIEPTTPSRVEPAVPYYEPNRPGSGGSSLRQNNDADMSDGRIVWSPSAARRQHENTPSTAGTPSGFKSLTTNPVAPIVSGRSSSSLASSRISSYPTHNMIGVNDNEGEDAIPRYSGSQVDHVSRKSSVMSALEGTSRTQH